MICPYCSSEMSKVIKIAHKIKRKVSLRRRECLVCLKRYTTIEKIHLYDAK